MENLEELEVPERLTTSGIAVEYPDGPMCGRCFAEGEELFPASCAEKPEVVHGLGMYHCPDCGAMVVAGIEHPDVCIQCRDKKHPSFDEVSP